MNNEKDKNLERDFARVELLLLTELLGAKKAKKYLLEIMLRDGF